MVVLAVTWKAKPGKEVETTRLFATLQEKSRQEPGCLLYVAHHHRSDRARFFVYEQYQDDAALEAHRESPHFQQYAQSELRQVAERVEGELYEPI